MWGILATDFYAVLYVWNNISQYIRQCTEFVTFQKYLKEKHVLMKTIPAIISTIDLLYDIKLKHHTNRTKWLLNYKKRE